MQAVTAKKRVAAAAVVAATVATSAWVAAVTVNGFGAAKVPAHVPSQPAARAAPFPRTVTDDRGHQITIAARPKRIVSNSITLDGLLLAILDEDRIAAVSRYSLDRRYSDVAETAARLGLHSSESAEVALSLQPDLVFAGLHARAEWLDLVRHGSAPIYCVGDTVLTMPGLSELIRRLGYITGEDARAEELAASTELRFQHALDRAAVATGPRPRVLGYDRSLSYSYGTETIFHDIVSALGATNVGAEQGLVSYHRVSSEQIARWNPDWIVTGALPGDASSDQRTLFRDPGIAVTNAVRHGRIVVLPRHIFLSTSHRVIDLAERLAVALFPDPT